MYGKPCRLLALLLVTALGLAFMLGGCTGTPPVTDPDVQETPGAQEDGAALRVALLINGTLGDLSFFDSTNAGMTRIKEELGAEIKVVEGGKDSAKWEPALEDLSNEGYDVIVCLTWEMSEILQNVSANHPDIHYVILDTSVDYSSGGYQNVYSAYERASDSSFLIGAFAAKVSTSDMPKANPEKVIGFQGGMDATNINDFLLGYIQGAQYVDPEMKVAVAYIGDWSDSMKCKELALAQFNLQGADVGFAAAGGAGLGVLDAAKEAGRYAIGMNTDQSLIFKDSDPEKAEAILSSCVSDMGAMLFDTIVKHIDGTLAYGSCDVFTLGNTYSYLSKSEYYQKNVSQDIQQYMLELEEKAASGEIKLVSAYDMSTEEVKTFIEAAKP